MSLTTAGIHCTISQRLSGATEDCSTVRVQQLRTLCRWRCCMSASQRMFGSLWNAATVHKHRRQDGSRPPGTMAKYQTTTGERTWHMLLRSSRDMSSSYAGLQDLSFKPKANSHLLISGSCFVCAQEHCRISPPRFLAVCHKKRLNQASFVLQHFVLFAFSGLCKIC